MLTVVLGLSTAVLWGAPGVPLAVAVRRIGPTAVLAGSLILGTLLIAPVGLFIDFPGLTERGLLLAALDGLLMAAAYGITYNAFARCPISVVTPIISCEGAAAAAIAIAFGERPGIEMAVLLVIAVLGVVLVGTAGRTGARVSGSGVSFAVTAALAVGLRALPRRRRSPTSSACSGASSSSARSPRMVMVPFLLRPDIRSGIRSEPWRILIWAAGDTGGNLCYFAGGGLRPGGARRRAGGAVRGVRHAWPA